MLSHTKCWGLPHRWIWSDTERRALKLLRFGETETEGGHDLVPALEKTSDLFLEDAIDEHCHRVMFELWRPTARHLG
jgi:hypothetical protein